MQREKSKAAIARSCLIVDPPDTGPGRSDRAAINAAAEGLAVVKKVRSPRVKLLYDIYHVQVMEGGVIRTIRGSIDHIGHFHTAGTPRRNDFDDTQELNYRGICATIAATDYDGYVGHEFRPKGDVITALRMAFELCGVR